MRMIQNRAKKTVFTKNDLSSKSQSIKLKFMKYTINSIVLIVFLKFSDKSNTFTVIPYKPDCLTFL